MIIISGWSIIDDFVMSHKGRPWISIDKDRDFLRQYGITIGFVPLENSNEFLPMQTSLDEYIYDSLEHNIALKFDDSAQELMFRLKYL